MQATKSSPLKAAAKGWVAGIDNRFAPENSGPFCAVGRNVECDRHHPKEFCFPTARKGGEGNCWNFMCSSIVFFLTCSSHR